MSFDKIYARLSLNLPQNEKELIQNLFTITKRRKNDIIIDENEDCNRLFFVIKGALRIFYFLPDGTESTRNFTFEGEFCTNLISFSGQDENHENIECLEDCLLYSISNDNFYEMLGKSPHLTHLYTKVLEKFIKYNVERFQFMNTLNERQRVVKCLKEFTEINLRIKDKIIATYLGVSPEFFSRIKSEFYKNPNKTSL